MKERFDAEKDRNEPLNPAERAIAARTIITRVLKELKDIPKFSELVEYPNPNDRSVFSGANGSRDYYGADYEIRYKNKKGRHEKVYIASFPHGRLETVLDVSWYAKGKILPERGTFQRSYLSSGGTLVHQTYPSLAEVGAIRAFTAMFARRVSNQT